MDMLGIPRNGKVLFGQLLGMRDHLTYPLGQAGYMAYKVEISFTFYANMWSV